METKPDSYPRIASGRCRSLAWWVRAALLFVLLGLYLARVLIKIHDPVRWAFHHDRSALDRIVTRVKSMPMPKNMCVFTVSPTLDPASVRPNPRDDADNDGYKISAYRRARNDYLVEIVISDLGHLGRYGLVYSDAPPTFHGNNDYPELDGGFLLLAVREKLADHWWYGYDNLE